MDHSGTDAQQEIRGIALLPFAVFLFFYVGMSIWAGDFYRLSMPVAFIVASASAFLLRSRVPFNTRVEIFARGMGEINIMMMCLIFILAGMFAATAKGMGAVESAVIIARHLVPDNLILVGIFLVASFISLAIGTSCGTIAAVMPIAVGLVEPLQLPGALIFGAVIGGAMFGDNMSMISDTTIAATRTQNVAMRDKFITNLRMILPAAAAVIVIYLVIGRTSSVPAAGPVALRDYLTILPYLLILVLALLGLNVMALLFCGTVLAAVIGIGTGAFDIWGALDLCGKGALGMSETLIVAILAGGLLSIIRYLGGIGFVLKIIHAGIAGKRGCEFGICLLVALVNLFTANNTVAIVIAGPIARELGLRFGCSSRRIASILDVASCAVQGVIPYGAQLLIAVGIAQTAGIPVSGLGLMGYLYYPLLLGGILILMLLITPLNKR